MARRIPTLFDDQSEDEPLINLTPLIDVVFVVLIAFMVLAPLLDIDKVQLAAAPDAAHKKESLQEGAPLAITVQKDNTIWIGKRQIALSDLEAHLKIEKNKYPGSTPKLFQDSRAQFGTYQAVKNRVEACGFEELDVVLQAE